MQLLAGLKRRTKKKSAPTNDGVDDTTIDGVDDTTNDGVDDTVTSALIAVLIYVLH